MKNDYLKWGALLFALVATASAEYELARQVGFNQWVAAAVPGALDIYTVRALRAHRDVLTAVGAMIGVNAASHLVTAGLLPVNVPLVVAVSAIAPLVLWRVHRLADEGAHPVETPDEPNLGSIVNEVPAVEVERVPETYPAIETAVPAVYPEPTNAVPGSALRLPLATRCGLPLHHPAPPVPEPVPAPEVPVPETPDDREQTIEPTEEPDPAEPEDIPEYPDPLIPRVRVDFPNEVPGVRRLKDVYGIGQSRAQRIRDELAGVAS